MVKFRILPLLLFGVTGLLCLKAMGLVLHGGYLFPNAPYNELDPDRASFGRMLSSVRVNPEYADPIVTGSVPEKKSKKEKDAAKSVDVAENKNAPAKPVEVPVTQSPPMPPSGTERQLIERLKDRRMTLEERANELDLRENLLKATEKKIEDRLDDLKTAETRADVTGTSRAKSEKENMKPLVIMYEAMKPKEAARVFEKLDTKVLLQVALAMNPRKMSEVLAAMSPDSAEKLTTAMAMRNVSVEDSGAPKMDAMPAGELPRLDAKK
jgi:flagellar motility protein MotE (MotC chaperone)